MNAVLPNDRDLYGSIGIGYGDLLVVSDGDLFGSEMNLASKLGEDIAAKMQILLTAQAFAALPPDRYPCTQLAYAVSGVQHIGYRVERS
jgi:class 3 adenylate cyclase